MGWPHFSRGRPQNKEPNLEYATSFCQKHGLFIFAQYKISAIVCDQLVTIEQHACDL